MLWLLPNYLKLYFHLDIRYWALPKNNFVINIIDNH